MTPAATDFAYAEDYSYTRDAPAEEPQAEAPMANEYKAEIGGAMGEMSFDDTAEAEEAPVGDPESQGDAADITEKSSTPRTFPSRRPTLTHLFPDSSRRSARSEASWKTPTFPAIRAGIMMERPPLSTAGPITHWSCRFSACAGAAARSRGSRHHLHPDPCKKRKAKEAAAEAAAKEQEP